MTSCPVWLPNTVCTDGDFYQVLSVLYSIFEQDIKSGACSFEGRPVWWDRNMEDWANSTYERGFLHLISREDYDEGARLFDPRRSERLPWCSPTVCNVPDPEILTWDYEERRSTINTYVWLKDWGYVVILRKKQTRNYGVVAHLVTAYYVDGNSTRRSLRMKYEKRVQPE